MTDPAQSFSCEAEAAFREAELGRDADAGQKIDAWESASDEPRRVWRSNLLLQRAVLRGPGASVDTALDHPIARKLVVRSAIARWDISLLRHVLGSWESDTIERRLATAWLHAMWLARASSPTAIERLAQDARGAGLAGAAIEAQSLVAFDALARGDLERATESARRASRMARVEGLLYPEILANLVLARVRRHQNAPHLAVRILNAVARHAPPLWDDWIAWELTLSGLPRAATQTGPLAKMRNGLTRVVEALATDEPSTSTLSELLRTAREADHKTIASDLERLLVVTTSADAADTDALAWRRGERDAPPAGTAGLVFLRSFGDDESSASYVLVSPNDNARRVAAPRVAAIAKQTGATVLGADQKPHARLDTGLAMLAFRPAGFGIAEYVTKLFGYPYEHDLHAAIVNSHVHRLRARVGSSAEIARDGDRITMNVFGPTLVRDPRSQESVTGRALRALARPGGMTAKDLARELHVPLRTIQRVVGELVEDETLSSAQRGRTVVYRVEDTTFSEATTTRTFPPIKSPGNAPTG